MQPRNSIRTDRGRTAALPWDLPSLRPLLLVAAAVNLLGLPACQLVERATSSPGLGFGVFSAEVGGRHCVFYVTGQSFETHGGGIRGGTRTHRSTKYRLIAQDARTGIEVVSVSLGQSDFRSDQDAPELIGIAGDLLWLWKGGLEGRDLSTLSTRVSSEDLARANPDVSQWIPEESKYFGPAPNGGALWFQGLDGRAFSVDPGSLEATLLEGDAYSQARDAASSWYFHHRDSPATPLWVSSDNGAQAEAVEVGGQWYILLNQDEVKWHRGGTLENFFSRDPRDEWYRSDSNPQGRQTSGLIKVKDRAFLHAGLLKHPRTKEAWVLENPTSVLLLHRKTIETHLPWQLSRMTLDGEMVWDVTLTIGDMEYVIDADGAVLVVGVPKQNERGTCFCAVGLEDGVVTAWTLAD